MSKTLGANSGTTEVLRLRKELIQAKTQITDLQDELEEKTNQYLNAIKSRNTYKEKLEAAKDNINRVEEIVQKKVTTALTDERKESAKIKHDHQVLLDKVDALSYQNKDLQQKNKEYLDQIQSLRSDYEIYTQNSDVRDVMKRMDKVRAEKEEIEKNNVQLMAEYNKLSNLIEDFTAENTTLRQMAGVPDNYGIDKEKIKLLNKEKIEDFRKLIKVLQEDNYKLEEERAKLKHALKIQSTLSHSGDPSQYFKHMSKDQIIAVNQFAQRLIQGDAIEPSNYYELKKKNEELQNKIAALESTGFQMIAVQLKNMLQKNGGLLGDDKNPNPLQKLLQDNEEIKNIVAKLLEQGIGNISFDARTTQKGASFYPGSFKPPVPMPDFDGSIQKGMSYRFDHSQLNVADKDGIPLTGSSPYEQAYLQLQLQEVIELNRRKEDALSSQKDQIEKLYDKIKDYLLIQDQLYKDYITLERNFQKKETAIKQQVKTLEDQLMEQQVKCKKYEETLRAIDGGNKDKIQGRIVDLTKQNAINDINLMKMARKYQALDDQWKLLSREYHARDGDLADKDVFVQQRINSLKRWKTEALLQLNLLFEKLKMAVPVTEFDEVRRNLNIQTLKTNTLQEKQLKLNAQILQMQKAANKNKEAEMDIQINQDIKRNQEAEIQILTKRLERHDPIFKWENQIFAKIAQVFIRAKVRPDQVFREFDKNGDGVLQKTEFVQCLSQVLKMGGDSLSNNEIDVLWEALDISRDGLVDRQEFARKLERFGLQTHTREEHIIYQLIEAVRRSTSIQNIAGFFQLIDSKGRGFITRDDFADLFISTKLKIDEKELDHFMNQFWKDDKAGIDYEGFLRIFKKYEVKLDDQNRAKNAGKFTPISEDTLRLKKHYFDDIATVLKQQNKNIKDMFRKVDTDNSKQINPDELFQMFQKMKLKITKTESDQIFSSMDFDRNGTVSEPEIQADFAKVVSKDIQDLIYEQRNLKRLADEENGSRMDIGIENLLSGEHKTSQLMTRIEILIAKNSSLVKKLEHQQRLMQNLEENERLVDQQRLDLEKSNEDLMIKNIEYQEEVDNLKTKANSTIPKENYQQLVQEREKLIEDLTSTRAGMLSYKKMTEVIAEQAKNLKFIHERKKDEHENLLQALREMQSESSTKDRIGKLYFIIMLSRWQEAAVNKKYGLVLSEVKHLRGELLSTDSHNHEIQQLSNACQEQINQKFAEISKLQQQCDQIRGVYITQGKADELARNYQNMCEDRTELEIKLMKTREELHSEQDKNVGLLVAKETAENLYKDLRHGQTSDISQRLIEMSNEFQMIKLNEYKMSREHSDMKQKVVYFERLLNQRNEAIFILEEKAAKSEADMFKEREEFRKRDNERKAQLFNYNRYVQNDSMSFGAPMNQRHAGNQNISLSEQIENAQNNTVMSVQKLNPHQLQRDIELRRMDQAPIYQRGFGADWTKSVIENEQSSSRIQRLEEQIKSLTNQLMQKETEIITLNKWQFGDQYLSSDDQIKDKIEEYKARVSAHQEKDAQEMADAAYQTVQTLQNMLEQKKELLKNKDQHMQKLRDQMDEQRKIDADTISQLRDQIAITGNSTLSKLHEAATRMETQSSRPTQGQQRSQADLSIHERKQRDLLKEELDKKDKIIKRLEIANTSRETIQHEFTSKLKEKERLIESLREQIKKLEDRTDLEKATKARQQLMAQIKQRDGQIEALHKAIDAFKDKMIEYERKDVDHHEENIILTKKDNLEIQRLKNELESEIKLKNMANAKKSAQMDECTRLKADIDKLKDLIKNDEIEKEKKAREIERLKTLHETSLKTIEKYKINEKKMHEEHKIGGHLGQGQGRSYDEIEARNTELLKENQRLYSSQQPVVLYNKANGTFEFIGQPQTLLYGKDKSSATSVFDVIRAIQNWLKQHDRITYKEIFKSMDKGNFGDLKTDELKSAFKRIGIVLIDKEIEFLQEKLDLKKNNLFEIAPLVRAISGVPTKQFLPNSILKLAVLTMTKDWDRQQCQDKITKKTGDFTLEDFKKEISTNLISPISKEFEWSTIESEEVFGFITKMPRDKISTAQIKIELLVEEIFFAVDAIIIEDVRQSLRRKQVYLIDLLHKHNASKNGNLTLTEVENFFHEIDIALSKKTQDRFFREYLDKRNEKRVSAELLKHFFGDESSIVLKGDVLDLEPSKESAKSTDATKFHPKASLSNAQYETCRLAARKVLNGYQGRLFEELTKLDPSGEGIATCEEIGAALQRKNIHDIQPSEIQLLVNSCDRGNHGVLVVSIFEKKLQEMAQETEKEKILKRFSKDVANYNASLINVLNQRDNEKTGTLSYANFKKAITGMSIPINEPEIKSLFEEGLVYGNQELHIKYFSDKVSEVYRSKAPQYFSYQQPKPGTAKIQTRFNSDVTAPEENQQKFKKSIDALKQELEEKNREIKSLNQAIDDSNKRVLKLENEVKKMESRLVDKYQKPPQEMKSDSIKQGNFDQIQQLKDEIHHMQNVNHALQKTIQVDLKAELSKVVQEKEEVDEKYKLLREQFNNKKLEIQRMTGSGAPDQISRREQAEESRQRRIDELEHELEISEENRKGLQNQLFTQQEKVLDLKFEKETFDLQYARLQKRITDLEYYKMQSSALSAALKGKHEEELAVIKDQSAKLTGDQLAQKPGESVKIRNKPSKSVHELELVVDALRRVQDKQKVEIDALKRTNERLQTANAKVGNEAELRVKINQLERVVHSYEMRDVNLGEQDTTIKKLIFANKQLREDITREIERYNLLESKYRDLLVKLNVLQRENDSNKELVFSMNTGAHMFNYNDHLTRDSSQE